MTVPKVRSPEAKSKIPDWGKKSPTLHRVAHGKCVGVDSGSDIRRGQSIPTQGPTHHVFLWIRPLCIENKGGFIKDEYCS
jgi:hypothetical protein